MQVTREELNPCTIQFKVICDADEVRDGFKKAYKHYAKQMRIPGFRPGQAPLSMVEKALGHKEVMDVASQEIVKSTYKKILDQEKIEPFEGPRVSIEKMDPEASECELIFKVPLPPVVELGDLEKLSAEKPDLTVTDEEVEEQIQKLREMRRSHKVIQDRAAENGDTVTVHIQARDGSEEGRTFILVVGETFDGMSKALRGMRTGDIKEVELSFPADFQRSDWANKTFNCKLTLHSISSSKLPEVDDDFVAAFSKEAPEPLKSKNVGELREKLKTYIGQVKEAMKVLELEDKLLDQLVESSKVAVPDTLWENVAERRLEEIALEAKERGQTFEQYVGREGKKPEELAEEIKNEAKEHVIRACVARELFVKENLKIQNEDLDRALSQIAAEYGTDPRTIYENLKSAQRLNDIHFKAIFNKVLDFLGEKANIRKSD